MGAARELKQEFRDDRGSLRPPAPVYFLKTEVFRRHHVLQDPINRIDPSGNGPLLVAACLYKVKSELGDRLNALDRETQDRISNDQGAITSAQQTLAKLQAEKCSDQSAIEGFKQIIANLQGDIQSARLNQTLQSLNLQAQAVILSAACDALITVPEP